MAIEIHPIKTEILEKNFDLADTISKYLVKNGQTFKNGDILVLSSKIVSVSQGKVVDLSTIKVSKKAKSFKRTRYGRGKEDPRIIELVLREADVVLPGTMILTLKDGILIPEAGIDLSNIPDGFAVVWPKNPWQTAEDLRKKLCSKFNLKNFGVVICDSHCQPLRWGTTGIAISWAGFEGVEDARGQKDIHGKALKITKKAVADNLSSSALLVMGEAGEKIPFVVIRNAPVKFTTRRQKKNEICVNPRDCIFGGIYSKKFLSLVK